MTIARLCTWILAWMLHAHVNINYNEMLGMNEFLVSKLMNFT